MAEEALGAVPEQATAPAAGTAAPSAGADSDGAGATPPVDPMLCQLALLASAVRLPCGRGRGWRAARRGCTWVAQRVGRAPRVDEGRAGFHAAPLVQVGAPGPAETDDAAAAATAASEALREAARGCLEAVRQRAQAAPPPTPSHLDEKR